jgi:hypothetical protein
MKTRVVRIYASLSGEPKIIHREDGQSAGSSPEVGVIETTETSSEKILGQAEAELPHLRLENDEGEVVEHRPVSALGLQDLYGMGAELARQGEVHRLVNGNGLLIKDWGQD